MSVETRDRVKNRDYFDKRIKDLTDYLSDWDWRWNMDVMTACYSRGDAIEDIRAFFPTVIRALQLDDENTKRKYGGQDGALLQKHKYGGKYRDALVLLTWALCLRAESGLVEILLMLAERRDALFEAIVSKLAPGREQPVPERFFPKQYDGLYAVLDAPPAERAALVGEYLKVWYSKKMKGFSFKDTHKDDNSGYVGYWCFEAAGVVAALDIDDASFRDHPHYPKDLVAYYRAHG